MKVINTILILALMIASVLFAVQNTETVTVTFIAWSVTGSLSLILIIALIVGFIIGSLLMAPSVLKKKFQSFGLKRRVSKLQREKDKLNKKIEKSEAQKEVLPQAEIPAETASGAQAASTSPQELSAPPEDSKTKSAAP
jgi:uncharacterized integral membrane protein